MRRSGQLQGVKLGPHAILASRFELRIVEDALRAFLRLTDDARGTEGGSATP